LSQADSAKAFSFFPEAPPATPTPARAAAPVQPQRPKPRPLDNSELERIRRALHAVEEVAYQWSIESDEIQWSSNAAEVLGCDGTNIATGRSFAALLDAENFTSRYDTIMRSAATDDGDGVPYQIEYLFRPDGRMGKRALWLEDSGRWFAGTDGRPAEAYGIVRRVDDRHKRDQHLSFLGNCDPLTGMMNRGRMAEALGEAISVAERTGGSCAFVVAGINNLAVVNDAYGFEVADEVIIAVGRRLRQVVRAGDALARYSGSKFGIILNNCTEEELQIAAERFLSVARESVIETERGPVWSMLSIGGLVLPKNAQDANTAMARAEEALTEAKRLPSDGFVLYQPSQRRLSERGLNARCATEIVACLKENRFKLAYQPIVSAKTGEAVMHEALLRMADSDGEVIAAAHLIPIAEKLGLVRLIDRTVVQLAVKTLLDYPEARITFNVSGTTATDPRWFSQLTDILAAHKDITHRLTVEITETIALSDLDETARFTSTLRDLGCAVAIDDFGAGYTSFRNLKSLNVDILKIDGTFCQKLKQNPDNQYFVQSLIDLAKKFDLKTVAEWMESPEDAELLTGWGVDFLQGNLFGQSALEPPWRGVENAPGAFTIPQGEAGEDNQDIIRASVPFSIQGFEAPARGEEPESFTPAGVQLDVAAPAAETAESSSGMEAPQIFEAVLPARDEAENLPEIEVAFEPPAEFPEASSGEDIQITSTAEPAAAAVPAEPLPGTAETPVTARDPGPAPAITLPEEAAALPSFEDSIELDLSRLRNAIHALNESFGRHDQPASASEDQSRPSFAEILGQSFGTRRA
jgi:diguanylate cyclase (GGDEF)-like protein